MKTTTNKDMLNAIRNQASEEYKEKMPEVRSEADAAEAQRKLNEYPTLKNEFIQTLTNKVIRSDFFSKVYNNPLKMLKKGSMPYGASIEELFVVAAKAKGFYESGKDTAEGLVSVKKPEIKNLYITKNYAYVFEVSISDAQLKAAFTSANGLSELVNQIVGSLTNGAEQKEYKDMIAMINAAANGKRLAQNSDGTTKEVGIPTSQGVVNAMAKEVVSIGGDYKKLAVKVRALAGRMKFVNTKYNMAGVDTFCSPEDLVFLTTPEILAELDVNVLAQAFNVSSAEVNVRTILVDELPKGFAASIDGSGVANSGTECYGILMDKAFIQAIDTVHETRQFENGRSLTTNLFLHKQGMLANCYFANCVALTDK